MTKRKRLVFPILVLLLGAAAVVWLVRGRSGGASNEIRVSGNIEITDADVSFKIAGKVVERPVDEGEMVKAGQLVARLEDADLLQNRALRCAEVDAAEAALAELLAGSRPQEIAQARDAVDGAKARLDELLAGSRPQEIAAAQASVQRALADEEYARIDLARNRELLQGKTVSQGDFDRAQAAYGRAHAALKETQENLKLVEEGPRKEDIDQARAALAESEKRLELVKIGPRKEEIDQARARVEQVKSALALAETQLGYATLTSPLSGVVLSKNVEPGEYVAPGTPVVTVGDLVHTWLRAYINETDLGRVKVGQPAQVTTDTYPGKAYEGHVSFISSEAEFTPKNVQTQKQRVKLVYRIKIDILNPNMELKPGMPADANVLASPGAP